MEREQLMAEIDLLKLLREEGASSGIIKIIDVFENTQKIQIVMEFIEGGNLYKWIKDNQRVPESIIRQIFQ